MTDQIRILVNTEQIKSQINIVDNYINSIDNRLKSLRKEVLYLKKKLAWKVWRKTLSNV